MIELMVGILLFAGCGGGSKDTTTTTESGSTESRTTESGTTPVQQKSTTVIWEAVSDDRISAPAGGVISVRVRAQIPEGLRLYTDREYTGLEFAPVPTTAVLQPQEIYGTTGDIVADEGSISKVDPHFGKQTLEYWVGTVTLNIPITLAADAAPGTYDASVLINYMSCTDKVCRPPTDAKVPVRVQVLSR